MEIPVLLQLPANYFAYTGNCFSFMGNLPKNGNLPIEAKGIPDIS